MSRTRAIFFAIILAAISYVLYANLSNPSPQPTSTSPDNTPPSVRGAVTVSLASSNTKRNWLDEVAEAFNRAGLETSSGKPVQVVVEHVTSGGSMNAIADGDLQPVAWSPGDGSWVNQLATLWQQRNPTDLISADCAPTVYAPLGFAMWRPMAQTLGWPDTPIGWDTIVELAADPQGWASYGRPEWGKFRFGHTHPAYANSGALVHDELCLRSRR